jgi:signal peptidase
MGSPQLVMSRIRALATILAAVAMALPIAAALMPVVGFKPLVVRSGSMHPAIETGDIIVDRDVAPDETGVGDIVTFKDPEGSEETYTHRVVEAKPIGNEVAFTTRGDANTGVEEWSVARTDKVGLYVFRVPKLGYVVAATTQPAVRLAVVGLVLALGLLWSLRRIWA